MITVGFCDVNHPVRRLFGRFRMKEVIFIVLFWCSVCYFMFIAGKNNKNVSFTSTRSLDRQLIKQKPSSERLLTFNFTIDEEQEEEEDNISIDKRPPLSEEEILNKLKVKSSVPPESWTRTKTLYETKDGCRDIPVVYDIDFNNIYWQRLTARNATFYIFSAYFDDRPMVGDNHVVRILSVIDKLRPPTVICQLRYTVPGSQQQRMIFTRSSYSYMWKEKWGNYKDGILQPFLITCHLRPKDINIIPTSVSLVEHHCDYPRNILKIIHNKPTKKRGFAVCVKYLDFLYEDKSLRLVEWIELLNILGAEKIFLYDLEIHPNISKVLDYYVDKGLIELTHISLPGDQPNIPGLRHLYLKSKLVYKRQNEIIPYNDCLYRNINRYNYLAMLDIDEVIMPLRHGTWNELMDVVVSLALEETNYTRASFDFRNVYFLDDLTDGNDADINDVHDIPKYLHMLQHVYRTNIYDRPGFFVKCFHNTNLTISVHNHFPLECFETCITYSVEPDLAQLQHYRKECVDKYLCKMYRENTVRDTSIWRFKKQLIKRSTKALTDMGFLNRQKKHSL